MSSSTSISDHTPTPTSSSNSNPTTTYRIIRVPRTSPRLADLVTKSRTTRLHALKTDPSSFLAQHAVEASLPVSVWHKRLTKPETTILACVATTNGPHTVPSDSSTASNADAGTALPADPEDDVNALLLGDWVALAAIRGPMTYDQYYVTPDMGLPIPPNPASEARWHVYDLYTLPSHRGRGLAKKLVNACIATAVRLSSPVSLSSPSAAEASSSAERVGMNGEEGVMDARIRLFMNPANVWLVRMYESLGFEAAGKVTLEEGFRANCLDESIPKNTRESEEGRKMWHTRFGVAMEQVVAL